MSSCVMTTPVPVSAMERSPALRALKRPRSSEDAMSIERILKAHKRSACDSPRATTTTTTKTFPSEPVEPTSPTCPSSWPTITATDSAKQAIAFLRDSRHHALVLLSQNQWHRALSVLDKVERANEIVARQRRRVVLEQANACPVTAADGEPKETRKVQFSDEVGVASAIDADRSVAAVPGFVREEILILRASRPIPTENYSEFWN